MAKATTYFKGDAAEYTGKVFQIHGGTFYEIVLVDGCWRGETRVTSKAPAAKAGA